MLGLRRMVRRPDFPVSAMTREQLKELKRSPSLLGPPTVRGNYAGTLQKCRLRAGFSEVTLKMKRGYKR
jgi:hypothetical protein